MYQLKDGRIVDANSIIDFDDTHTNSVSRLTAEEYAAFVVARIPTVPQPPQPPPQPPPPATSLTPRQARLALNAAGLLPKVEAAVAAADKATQITWEFATTIERGDPLLASLAAALQLSSAQIDDLFKTGATL